MDRTVDHRTMNLNGASVFYRECGSQDAPVLLLPHGYPCSSYEFRNLMPALADNWRTIAPDFPGSGLSNIPQNFPHNFDGMEQFLTDFTDSLGLDSYVLYLHDFGSQIGLRHAIRHPERIQGLIIQNGDIYEDTLGPKYAALKSYFENPDKKHRSELSQSISWEGFKDEFLNDVRPALVEKISPDLWNLHWSYVTPERKELFLNIITGLQENLEWFPRYQSYLREHNPQTLIVWGPQDGFMPKESALAYLRDLPDAELHLLDGGHWLLESSFNEALPLIRKFLKRLEQSIPTASNNFKSAEKTYSSSNHNSQA